MSKTIDLGGGVEAEYMGDDTFVVTERDERGVPQAVVLSRKALRRLLASNR